MTLSHSRRELTELCGGWGGCGDGVEGGGQPIPEARNITQFAAEELKSGLGGGRRHFAVMLQAAERHNHLKSRHAAHARLRAAAADSDNFTTIICNKQAHQSQQTPLTIPKTSLPPRPNQETCGQ